jgi:hypothetical protein
MELASMKMEKSVSAGGECWVIFEALKGDFLVNFVGVLLALT